MKPYESRSGGAGRAPVTDAFAVPVNCPACQSRSISTTAKKPDENSYWRCSGCGEVWNAGRRKTRLNTARPWYDRP
jgi:transposase-like protein